jgi:hypothetical protein
MRCLPSGVWQTPYRGKERGDRQGRQPPGRWRGDDPAPIGGGQRDESLDTGSKPDDTTESDALLVGDAEERKCQSIEGMAGVSDLNRVCWKRGETRRRTVLSAV